MHMLFLVLLCFLCASLQCLYWRVHRAAPLSACVSVAAIAQVVVSIKLTEQIVQSFILSSATASCLTSYKRTCNMWQLCTYMKIVAALILWVKLQQQLKFFFFTSLIWSLAVKWITQLLTVAWLNLNNSFSRSASERCLSLHILLLAQGEPVSDWIDSKKRQLV